MRNARLSTCTDEYVELALEALDGQVHVVAASDVPGDLLGLTEPGLYAWWVDEPGAAELLAGLEESVVPGRIYAGQAGATCWPSRTPSAATLGSRLSSQHLGGNVYGSTFRLTLASCLAPGLDLTPVGRKRLAPGGEERLSAWIREHLGVAVFAFGNRDALEHLEHRVFERLDPPLNLRGMPPSRTRQRLGRARRSLSGAFRATDERVTGRG